MQQRAAAGNRIKFRRIWKILLSILLIIVLFFTVDTILIHANRRPIFCFPVGISDGGSAAYYGLGYQYIVWHQMDTVDGAEGYWVGTELHWPGDYRSITEDPSAALEFVQRDAS